MLGRPDAACTSYRIDFLRNGGAIGIRHHVPSILDQVQDGSGHRTVEITRLFGLDDLVPCAMEDVDWTLNAWIMRLEFRGHRNEEGAFLRSRPQLFGRIVSEAGNRVLKSRGTERGAKSLRNAIGSPSTGIAGPDIIHTSILLSE
jgi:hypothetical protein